ncbi:MAG: alpha/beta hydrolase [Synechococcaceae cyanobacterium]|nr:alpha/beta hydrolase [Synechococcaceae cyanobacterium]
MAGWEHHRWHGFTCAHRVVGDLRGDALPLLTVHPIGVGLSGAFWRRFDGAWERRGLAHPRIHPDLLGCGASALPHRPIHPGDWAAQLASLLEEQVRRPVLLVVQGASFPIAIELHQRLPEAIRAMVLAGPPAWHLITDPADPRRSERLWRWFFDTPAGALFYRYARTRRFLRSFSIRQLFADPADVDEEWLTMLEQGSRSMDTRHAVFSFLAGWWRRDYGAALAELRCPVLALFGERASGIGRGGGKDPPARKVADYASRLPAAEARLLPGRNVLPWEQPEAFADAVAGWMAAALPSP